MPKETPLRDVILAAVSNWVQENGGGMVNAFVFGGDYITEDGGSVFMFSEGSAQSISRSLGIHAHLGEILSFKACQEIAPALSDEDEDF
jgi:hypothetical protein